MSRGVTYAGYVGVLTGVRYVYHSFTGFYIILTVDVAYRKGLSISLNYRVRIDSTSSACFHRAHQLLLLMGLRRSVSSRLRKILLDPGEPPSLHSLKDTLTNLAISPCFLTFCTPSSVLIMEKDLHTANAQISSDFLAVTNHDQRMELWTTEQWRETLLREKIPEAGREILDDSMERKRVMATLWRSALQEQVDVKDVSNWLKRYPLRNETTHFSCLMNPAVDGGGLIWVEENVELLQREGSSSSSRSPSESVLPPDSMDSLPNPPSAVHHNGVPVGLAYELRA